MSAAYLNSLNIKNIVNHNDEAAIPIHQDHKSCKKQNKLAVTNKIETTRYCFKER